MKSIMWVNEIIANTTMIHFLCEVVSESRSGALDNVGGRILSGEGSGGMINSIYGKS